VSDDDLMWEPKAYPKCSKCGMPWIYRKVYKFGPPSGSLWIWQPDCKHKADPELVEVQP
jgi:hypothetical protein